ncbi:bifunctional 4-hydroxy-2-oxoglutarate aldolase/2-dehydro-3-deoxy-phosphogluconate aldolase [Pelagicoccus mobilis]|uniref:2-dehydro-3-deoxy-phosphogluconate aldolase n=1 Tax=Pelagicoccus mobilis TaxID=415221 RepID=A0A934VP76_9BACT|nr:bifunctional 4-hydroxy-2-oxoglutarate aldolase/2-dehydro-3-deoxy-phosphogluconate aldolase [Pelagicoccus mobilis]MBK1875254.1 bifunctional 4-hydroxy-2-oxoglutarate aldolase/2-dehydro-3-deoxy-phosphogluconate aldolase [Pelagicoccus mobilis]
MLSQSIEEQVRKSGIIAVTTIEDAKNAVPTAQALVRGGVTSIELTLRTPAALDAIRAIRAEVPEVLLGAGTILTPKQVDDAMEAGVAFGVAPGLNPKVIEYADKVGLPFAPGVMTPSDIECALDHGCKTMKLFPAESIGGMKTLSTMAAPYKHLGLGFIPLGGLNEGNMASYLSSPLIAAIGGSWLAKPDKIAAQDWDAIEAAARSAVSIATEAKS